MRKGLVSVRRELEYLENGGVGVWKECQTRRTTSAWGCSGKLNNPLDANHRSPT